MKDQLLENADSEGNLWCHSEECTDTCGPETGFHQLVFHEIPKYVDVQQSGVKQHPFTFQRQREDCPATKRGVQFERDN